MPDERTITIDLVTQLDIEQVREILGRPSVPRSDIGPITLEYSADVNCRDCGQDFTMRGTVQAPVEPTWQAESGCPCCGVSYTLHFDAGTP